MELSLTTSSPDTAVIALPFLRPLEGRITLRFVVDVSRDTSLDARVSELHDGVKRESHV